MSKILVTGVLVNNEDKGLVYFKGHEGALPGETIGFGVVLHEEDLEKFNEKPKYKIKGVEFPLTDKTMTKIKSVVRL